MKFYYCSDLHLEFENPKDDEWIQEYFGQERKEDCIILAGDICALHLDSEDDPHIAMRMKYVDLLSNCSTHYKHVILVAGNHEYYGSSIEKTNLWIETIVKELNNVHFLNNSSFQISSSLTIIGSTLWSFVRSPLAFQQIADSRAIHDFSHCKYLQMHDDSKRFLMDEIRAAEENKQQVIVVTHHLPSYSLIDEKYKGFNLLNKCFASDLPQQEFMMHPKYWVYGHSHSAPKQTIIGNATFLCNMRGYTHESDIQSTFQLDKFFEI